MNIFMDTTIMIILFSSCVLLHCEIHPIVIPWGPKPQVHTLKNIEVTGNIGLHVHVDIGFTCTCRYWFYMYM